MMKLFNGRNQRIDCVRIHSLIIHTHLTTRAVPAAARLDFSNAVIAKEKKNKTESVSLVQGKINTTS